MTDDPSAQDAELIRAGRRALRELPDAPEWRILRAEAIFRAVAPQSAPLLDRVIAVLSFDSWASPAPALRGGQVPGGRQLLFTAADYDIALRLTPASGTWAIEGQVLGPGAADSAVCERDDGAPPRQAPIDELGTFRFEGLAPGSIRLAVRLGSMHLELPALGLDVSTPDA
jgi:hypothetical protein